VSDAVIAPPVQKSRKGRWIILLVAIVLGIPGGFVLAHAIRVPLVKSLENYQPAVPVTVEGILYAGGGLLVGYLVLSGIWRFLAMPFRRRYPAYR